MKESVLDLINREKWQVVDGKVTVNGQQFPVTHPALIHLKLYGTETNPELKYYHMKAAHDYLWPQDIPSWHYWTETRFREHCAGWNYVGWSGGASTGKSYDAAKVALLFWFAAPRKRGVIIASVSLQSLSSRVWGYCTKLLSSTAIKLPYDYLSGNSPQILPRVDKQAGEVRSAIHGIFAVAARQGSDDSAISTWIGRHPDDALMLVLDEATDLNSAIVKSFPNLDSSEKPFQCIAIGNSNSWYDLHGTVCYPKDGIESVDPLTTSKWATTQKNGIALLFSCYDSPAVHEVDPKKKKILSKFLITQEQIDEKEKLYGKDSDSFYRFVLGYWRSTSTEGTIVSRQFLEANGVNKSTEWLGIQPLKVVGGLDPAFSTGGDQCILRLAILGQSVDGGIVLDFKGDRLLFRIQIAAKSGKSAEIQIAEQVMDILDKHGCSLSDVACDATGQGRALSGTLQLYAKALKPPLKIYSTRVGNTQVNSFDCTIKTSHELWFDLRNFIESGQIRGLDQKTILQLSNRLVVNLDAKGKPCPPKLETKADFKRRMGGVMPSLAHSPDEADSAALCVQSAMINYGFKIGQRLDTAPVLTFFDEKMNAFRKEIKMEEQKHEGPLVKSGYSVPIVDFKVKHSPFS